LVEGAIQNSDFSDELVIDRRRFDSFEGALARVKGTRRWTILLNIAVSNSRRQRFTFAHELGHFMCHRELKDTFEDSEESLNDFRDQTENDANVFASWLLMPANLLRAEFKNSLWTTATLQAIGDRFQCSLQASALRYVAQSSRPLAFVVSRDGIILWAAKSDTAPYMKSYLFGDELPPDSDAMKCYIKGDQGNERVAVGPIWNETRHAFESQYFDHSGHGYQYTCIEFQ